jgi:hypothetical protein
VDKFAKQNGRFVKKPRHIIQNRNDREVSDGSSDVIIFILAIMCLLGAAYAILKALNLI